MKKIIILLGAVMSFAAANAQIERVQLLDSAEMAFDAADIVHLDGIGLGLQCGPDSLMLLDSPTLASIHWVEPNLARSFVACRGALYAAEGDSIYRVATDSLPGKFVARFDNEQFSLFPASDSTFYACTADETFSCVYEIDPVAGTCLPLLSMKAPILKISTNGSRSMIWVDDQVLLMTPDERLVPVFTSATLSDMVLTPIGLMAGTADGVYWVVGPGNGGKVVNEPVTRLWWDDDDVLYYVTAAGKVMAVSGMQERYMQLHGLLPGED